MKNIIKYAILLGLIPIIIVLGVVLLNDKQYDIISILVALIATIPFFMNFEKRKPDAREIVLLATLTAIGVVSRIAFSLIPGVKPVSAFIIIVAIVYGKETGFMVGALTALLSNIYFGQGAWTPFQMFSWGFIGFIAGALGKYKIFNNFFMIIIYALISGAIYSLILDFHTVLFFFNSFSFSKYFAAITASSPVMITYIISNGIFIIPFSIYLPKELNRIKVKYGLFQKRM